MFQCSDSKEGFSSLAECNAGCSAECDRVPAGRGVRPWQRSRRTWKRRRGSRRRRRRRRGVRRRRRREAKRRSGKGSAGCGGKDSGCEEGAGSHRRCQQESWTPSRRRRETIRMRNDTPDRPEGGEMRSGPGAPRTATVRAGPGFVVPAHAADRRRMLGRCPFISVTISISPHARTANSWRPMLAGGVEETVRMERLRTAYAGG